MKIYLRKIILKIKSPKNIDLLYRTKLFLDKNSHLLTVYYSYIHIYLNCAKLSWGSISRTNLKKLLSQQKHAVRIINKRTHFNHTNEKVERVKYQIRTKTAPLAFSGSFEKIYHGYPTNFSQLTIKFLKPHLAKANSESHLEDPPSGITFSKILKKKLNHFRSLKLFRSWVFNICWRKGAWWQNHSCFLRVLPRFKNQYESYYLQLEKIFMHCICTFVIYEGYEENIYEVTKNAKILKFDGNRDHFWTEMFLRGNRMIYDIVWRYKISRYRNLTEKGTILGQKFVSTRKPYDMKS